MIEVAILEEQLLAHIQGAVYDNGGSKYAPRQDANGNWFITVEEIQATTNPLFKWVKTLELSPYYPPPNPPMIWDAAAPTP